MKTEAFCLLARSTTNYGKRDCISPARLCTQTWFLSRAGKRGIATIEVVERGSNDGVKFNDAETEFLAYSKEPEFEYK